MNGRAESSTLDGVYASKHRRRRGPTTSFELTIQSDATQCTLERLFGLLTTIAIVPDHACSTKSSSGTLRTSMRVTTEDEIVVDLLSRKIVQLTETLSLSVSIVDDQQ